MIVAFTGTQHGMTVVQRERVAGWIALLANKGMGPTSVFRHGLCVGADAQAHAIVRTFSGLYVIDGYPALVGDGDKRAALPPDEFRYLHWEKPPLERNRDLVDGLGREAPADVLLVAPRQRSEVVRSGTWSTYRYASRKGVTTIICWP